MGCSSKPEYAARLMESYSLLSNMLMYRVPADGPASSEDLHVTADDRESAADRATPFVTPTCGEVDTANSSETRQLS